MGERIRRRGFFKYLLAIFTLSINTISNVAKAEKGDYRCYYYCKYGCGNTFYVTKNYPYRAMQGCPSTAKCPFCGEQAYLDHIDHLD